MTPAAALGEGAGRGRWQRALSGLRVLVALAGIALVVLVIRHEDPSRIAEALRRARPVLPLAFGLEFGRLVMEAFASRSALGVRGKQVPWWRLLLAQFVAHGMLNVAPVGRTSAEVTKAALLGRWVGGAEAAAAGALMQSATFVAVATVSLVCGLVTLLASSPATAADPTLQRTLAGLLFANAALLFCLGVGLRALLRHRRVVDWMEHRFPSHVLLIERFRREAAVGNLFSLRPALFLTLGMVCQILQMKVLADGVGAVGTVHGAFAAQGVHLVMASLAAFVPGQLGAREAAFGLAAKALGTTPAAATSIALLAHASQIALALVGFLVLIAWRRRVVPGALARPIQ